MGGDGRNLAWAGRQEGEMVGWNEGARMVGIGVVLWVSIRQA